jgi:AAA15 family ATPase/GTPase
MLTRIHVDNFRCLENFHLKLDRLNLLMGPNGSGKTSVFEVLRRLRQFLAGDCKIQDAFPSRDPTRRQTGSEQRFEMDLQLMQHSGIPGR